METIYTLLHIPETAKDCSLDMLKQLKSIRKAMPSCLKVFNELWDIHFDDPEKSTAVYSCIDGDREYWSGRWDMVQKKKIAKASGDVRFDDSDCRKNLILSFSATMMPKAEYVRLPRENGERYIWLGISADLWKLIDQKAFVECIKDAFQELNATYACIDEDAPAGIYEASFMLLSKAQNKEQIEKKLPGIYWTQIVSEEIIRSTGSAEEVVDQVPCERKELIETPDGKAVLMQIALDVRRANRKKRLEMRKYFQKSLYEICVTNEQFIRGWNLSAWRGMPKKHQTDKLRRLKMIPLTDDELSELIPIISLL